MYSYHLNTPYNLNTKLHSLNKYSLLNNADINILYKNLNNSIPELTNQFTFLKNRTKALNRSLNKIPVIYNNLTTNPKTNIIINTNPKTTTYSTYTRDIKTSPNLLTPNYFFSNYSTSYMFPKPILKPYIEKNNSRPYSNLLDNNRFKNKFINNIKKNDNQMKFNHNYISGNSRENNPIKKFALRNNNKNNSVINMIRDNYRQNKMKNYGIGLKNNINTNKSENKNKSVLNKIKNPYKTEINKLNKKIDEKDKIIHKMQGIIDDTFYKLNKKNEENSLLQSEILELKSRSNFDINNNYLGTSNNNNNDKKISNLNNTEMNERIKKIKYKRKKHVVKNNNINNRYKTFNRNELNKMNHTTDFDIKWEEIRKLNKKMDSLLHKTEGKIKKYERIFKTKINK